MARDSKIAWTRSTFNPWIGCTEVGPGCDNCYAREQDSRMRWGKVAHWGAGVPRHRTAVSTWTQVRAWNRRAIMERAKRIGFQGRPGFWPVFCASLADVFDNEIPAVWRENLFALIEESPALTWYIVTKRIGNVARFVPASWRERYPANIRILISVVNQEELDRDAPKLLALPVANGISYEPALGPLNFSHDTEIGVMSYLRSYDLGSDPCRGLEWVIVGGESGPKARPFDIRWAWNTVAQCRAAGVPVFVKQMGARCVWSEGDGNPPRSGPILFDDPAGADPTQWPPDLRVQEFPA